MKLPIGRALYHWVYGVNASTGKAVVIGPYNREDEAKEGASDLGEVRIWTFPTRDQNRATRMVKAKLAGSFGFAKALNKVSHRKNDLGESETELSKGDSDEDEL